MMSDKEFMIFVKNTACELSNLAQEKGVAVKIYCSKDYISAEVDGYRFSRLELDGKEYETWSADNLEKLTDISEIHFGKQKEEDSEGEVNGSV